MNKLCMVAAVMALMPATSFAVGQWRLHPSYSDKVERVLETPGYVYMTVAATPSTSNRMRQYILFRYDKEGEEFQALSPDNLLSYYTVQDVQYNPSKKYLAVIYTNSDIDLIYENGNVVNIPAYRMAHMSGLKDINSISVDPDHDRIYLATNFGYIAVNDKKGEIAETRDYGRPIMSVGRLEDHLILLTEDEILHAPANDIRHSIGDYEKLGDISSPSAFYSLNIGKAIIEAGIVGQKDLYSISYDKHNFSLEKLKENAMFYNLEHNSSGITVPTGAGLTQYTRMGAERTISRPEDLWSMAVSSYNMSEVWHGDLYKGLSSGKPSSEGWVVTRDFMLPNAPGTFYSSSMTVHPSKGLLVASNGQDFNFSETYNVSGPQLFSGYSSGVWTNYSPAFTNPDQRNVMSGPLGIVVDPNDTNYVYLTSDDNGLVRINLNNPEDIIHLSAASDRAANLPGFVELLPPQASGKCHFSMPAMDYYGNLWWTFAAYEDQTPEKVVIYYWSAADRKNTTSATNISLPKRLEVKGYPTSNMERILPLRNQGKRNVLVHTRGKYDEHLMLIDTKGTPEDPSDDNIQAITTFYDQDGNTVDVHGIAAILEDEMTGNVWVGHRYGVFYFNPTDFLAGKTHVYRVKVARNDGTNLADYLLNGVKVNRIISDGSGRKWFATGGGGLVCTTYDGREIVMELNTSNSDLPDDNVYNVEYYPANNSLMLSTDQGLVEYFISGNAGGTDEKHDIKCYPNPVRPEYLGYVTIEGIPTGSLVKIADSGGHVIKELGVTTGSEVQWDVTNTAYKRVNSGVYYILASPTSEDSGSAIVGKVLVVN